MIIVLILNSILILVSFISIFSHPKDKPTVFFSLILSIIGIIVGTTLLLSTNIIRLGISSGDLHSNRYADERRESSIYNIKLAEENYFSKNATFTNSRQELSPLLGGQSEYLDYKTKKPYFLQTINNGQDFIIGAHLDTNECYVCTKTGCFYEALDRGHC